MSPSPYVVRQDAVTPYSPLNHEATVNRRLVGRDNVGARQLEVVLGVVARGGRSEEHTSELQSRLHLVCRLLLEKKKPTRTPPQLKRLATPSSSNLALPRH